MKRVTIEKYNKMMDEIIRMNMSAEDTLIAMLEKAAQYEIIDKCKIKESEKTRNG